MEAGIIRAEDRATQGCDPSAASEAETDGAAGAALLASILAGKR